MSYILDALKKSEAQRRPDRPAEAVFAPAAPISERRPPPWGLIATALAVLALAVALYGLGRGSFSAMPNGADDAAARFSAPRVSASAGDPPAPVKATPEASTTPSSERPFPGQSDESAMPAAALAPQREKTRQAESAGRIAPAPPAAAHAAPEPAPTRGAEAVATAPETAPPAAPQPAPPVAATAAPALRSIAPAPLLQTLPTEVRARLPDFTLNIHVYSDEPAARFVFINNRRYQEGESIAEGGQVEAITPAGVILSAGGERFRLAL